MRGVRITNGRHIMRGGRITNGRHIMRGGRITNGRHIMRGGRITNGRHMMLPEYVAFSSPQANEGAAAHRVSDVQVVTTVEDEAGGVAKQRTRCRFTAGVDN